MGFSPIILNTKATLRKRQKAIVIPLKMPALKVEVDFRLSKLHPFIRWHLGSALGFERKSRNRSLKMLHGATSMIYVLGFVRTLTNFT